MTLVDRIEQEIRAERARQDEKWGVQNHPMTFPGSLRDARLYRSLADAWKAENDHRVAESRKKGAPGDRNCAWDGILGEEFSEAFAEERPGLQYAEMVQTAGVAFAILEFLNRQAKEQTSHLAWCPALDVDWILTAPELCDCEEKPPRFVARESSNGLGGRAWGVWDRRDEQWVGGEFGSAHEARRHTDFRNREGV